MNAVVVANGEIVPAARVLECWQRADLRVAANGGTRHARLYLETPPHLAVGDLDSMDAATRGWLEQHGVEFVTYPRAKSATDLELALELARTRGADELTVLGAFGGRVDHWLANVMLLTRYPRVVLLDASNEMWVGSGDEVIRGRRGDVLSLIPLDEQVVGVETDELEYPLRRETLARGSTRGISNVLLGERARVRWTSGMLLLVHHWQENGLF